MDKLGRWLFKIAIALIVLTIAVQIGIYKGRRMERRETPDRELHTVNALLHTDGYLGKLVRRDGGMRIIYSYEAARLVRARDLPSPQPSPARGEGANFEEDKNEGE